MRIVDLVAGQVRMDLLGHPPVGRLDRGGRHHVDGGLYSTASDYGLFLRMLLNRGRLGQARILSEKSVKAMFENHTGKVVVIDFWGSWCVHCLQSMPHLNILQERYGSRLKAVRPTPASEFHLYGDAWSAPDVIDALNAELEASPERVNRGQTAEER